MLDRLTESLLQRVFAPLVRTGKLEIVAPSGRVLVFGDEGQPQARIRFTDRRAVLVLLRDPDLNFGEMFMQERLRVVQDIAIFQVQLARGQEAVSLTRLSHARLYCPARNTVACQGVGAACG